MGERLSTNQQTTFRETAYRVGEKVLERTYFSHSFTLFLAEGVLINALAFIPNAPSAELTVLSNIFYGLSALSYTDKGLKYRMLPRILLGDHLLMQHARYRWPTKKVLSDGAIVRPGEKYGALHFTHNLPVLQPEDNLTVFTRNLYQSAENSLRELAVLCENDAPMVRDIEVFGGISHVAGSLATRAGFDLFTLDPATKLLAMLQSEDYLVRGVRKHNEWKRSRKNFKAPRRAFISKTKLIQLYGSTTNA